MQRKPIINTRRPIQKPLFTIDDFLGCNSCIMNKTSKPKSTDIVECCNGTPLVTIGDFEKVEDGENYIREYIKNNEETPFFLVHYDNYKNPKLPQEYRESSIIWPITNKFIYIVVRLFWALSYKFVKRFLLAIPHKFFVVLHYRYKPIHVFNISSV